MTWAVNGKPIASVLVTRLRYLGDVVMSTVVCEALKAGDPNLRLGYLAEENYGQILNDEPILDEVHLLKVNRSGEDARVRAAQSGFASRSRGTVATILELRRQRYDLAIDLFFNPRSAWLLRLAGIPVRIGGTQKSRRRLYTHTVIRSEVENAGGFAAKFADLAPGGLGEHLCRLAPLTHCETGLSFVDWLPTRYQTGELKPQLKRLVTEAAEPYLVLAPAATWPAKEWPLDHWRSLVDNLLSVPRLKLKILVPPGRAGEWTDSFGEQSQQRLEVLPPLALERVKNLLSQARGLITVDGGVMHMSVALGVPTLALFGPTDPDIWFPYNSMGPFQVMALRPHCHPCDRHQCDEFICLPDLAAEGVTVAAKALFDLAPESMAGHSQ